MEVDRTYTQETTKHHHPSSHHMEPPGKRRRGRPRNTWQRDTEKRNKGDGIRQERNGEDGHGQKTVAFLGRWPMLPASKQA